MDGTFAGFDMPEARLPGIQGAGKAMYVCNLQRTGAGYMRT